MNNTGLQLISKRSVTKSVQLFMDIFTLSAALVLAYLMRFNFSPDKFQREAGLAQLPFVVLLQFSALLVAGVYNFVWRYVGMTEAWVFLRAAGGSLLMLLMFRLWMPDFLGNLRVPLSIILLDTVFGFTGVLSLRVLRRALYEQRERECRGYERPEARKPVLLVGAGNAGMLAAREIVGRGQTRLKVIGFVDDDPRKLGSVMQGVKVLGRTNDIPRLVRRLGVDHVIITIAAASRQDIKRIVELCKVAGVKARIIPGLFDLLDGMVSLTRIKDVEIEDLLGRAQVALDDSDARECISGKTVMVTGAGGSIGSELARQVALLAPSRLLLVERAEFVLFAIHRELAAKHPGLGLVPLVADVGDEGRMKAIFETYRPSVVIHAAAHKHVPMMEWNPCEAVKNNVLGTEITGRLAGEYGTDTFIFISTDKAVNPASIMGASKRMAELVIQGLGKQYRTRYEAVRFGNVLGSTGSVIPIFREQIARGGPVTVTHPAMERYFMTIPEAAQLVLQAGAMGKGGEIFILDMGEPVKILDLAKQMITLSGFKPGQDMEIVFTGIRPGEKMSEELMNWNEAGCKTRHPKIFIGKFNNARNGAVQEAMRDLVAAVRQEDHAKAREALRKHISEARL